MDNIVRSVIVSGFLGGIFSYFASIYDYKSRIFENCRIFVGVTSLYFILLNISWVEGETAMLDFNKHAILGTTITMLAMFLTFCLTLDVWVIIFTDDDSIN